VGNLDHLGLGAELQEPDPPKRLDEQVCKLILGVDVVCLDAPFFQTTSDEVVPHPDVLAPFMENRVLGQGQSGLAVHSEFHRSSVSVEEITKQSNKPDRLSRSGGSCYVLGLVARVDALLVVRERGSELHRAGLDVSWCWSRRARRGGRRCWSAWGHRLWWW
jgi:hypothetical protein